MIGIRTEYERMFEAEHDMWWFKALHQKTLGAIQARFGTNKSIKILDAGCGTGGMLYFLQENGYHNLLGFDLSEDAVEYAQSRGLDVRCWDLADIEIFESNATFDVIICNDILCFFDDAQIIKILHNTQQKLTKNGLIISNNAAIPALGGAHDIVLKVPRRFLKAEFKGFTEKLPMSSKIAYWSATLTPLIWLLRASQRLSLWLCLRKVEDLRSDVDVPHWLINNTLYRIVMGEQALLGNAAPFGSSVFVVFQK